MNNHNTLCLVIMTMSLYSAFVLGKIDSLLNAWYCSLDCMPSHECCSWSLCKYEMKEPASGPTVLPFGLLQWHGCLHMTLSGL